MTGSRHALKRTMNDSSAIGSPSARLRRDLGAVQERAERERVAARPVGLASSAARRAGTTRRPARPEPLALLSGEERRPPEHGMLGAEAQQPPRELEEPAARARRPPSRPRTARCPGSRRCCCPSCVSAGTRRRRGASAFPGRGAASRGSCGIWRSRSALTSGSSVSPSTPQFQERLSSVPSRLPSRFASLCLRSYETRSRSVNPSWQVTKLIDADGMAPVRLVEVARAGEAARELARRPCARARSRASCRGTSRSTRTRGSGSSRPGSRRGRRPTARRSASPG